MKIVYLDLGISMVTLYKRIALGYYPPLQKDPNSRVGMGYFEDVFEIVKSTKTPSRGRPKRAAKIKT